MDIENVDIVCVPYAGGANPTGSIGLENIYGEESTRSDYITIHGCYKGFHLGSGAQAQNSGPFNHFAIGFNGITTGAVSCMNYTGTSGSGPTTIQNFSCGGYSGGTGVGVYIDGVNLRVIDIHCQNLNNGCIEVGKNAYSEAIKIENVVCISASPCVDLSNSQGSESITVESIHTDNSGITFRDNQSPGACTVLASNEAHLGFYSRSAYSNVQGGNTGNNILTTASECINLFNGHVM